MEWDRIIATNLTAPVKMMRAVVPEMKNNGGGSIVNVANKGGTSGAATGVSYTARTRIGRFELRSYQSTRKKETTNVAMCRLELPRTLPGGSKAT